MVSASDKAKSNSRRRKNKNFKFRVKAKNPTGRELFDRLPTYLKIAFRNQAPDYVIYAALMQKYCKENKKVHDNPISYINSELHLKPEYAKYGESQFSEILEISKSWYLQSLKILFDSKKYWLEASVTSKGPIEKAIAFIQLIDQAEMFLNNYKFIADEAYLEEKRIKAAQELTKKKLKEERDKELNEIYERVSIISKIRAEEDINLHLKTIKKSYEGLVAEIEKTDNKIWERQSKYDSHHDIRIFLRSCLTNIDEPLIASLFTEIKIRMWDILENEYEISLLKLNLNSYLYLLYRKNERNWTEEISRQYINTPTGFFDSLDATIRFNDLKINRVEFKRPAVELSVESWIIAYMAPPNERELTEAFFYRPEFFHFEVTCKSCGTTLKNVISALNQKGPVCGNHRYTWAIDHVPKVIDLIMKKYQSRDLFYSSSPLLEMRSSYNLKPITRSESNISFLRSFLEVRQLNPSVIENLVRARVGRNYYSSR